MKLAKHLGISKTVLMSAIVLAGSSAPVSAQSANAVCLRAASEYCRGSSDVNCIGDFRRECLFGIYGEPRPPREPSPEGPRDCENHQVTCS